MNLRWSKFTMLCLLIPISFQLKADHDCPPADNPIKCTDQDNRELHYDNDMVKLLRNSRDQQCKDKLFKANTVMDMAIAKAIWNNKSYHVRYAQRSTTKFLKRLDDLIKFKTKVDLAKKSFLKHKGNDKDENSDEYNEDLNKVDISSEDFQETLQYINEDSADYKRTYKENLLKATNCRAQDPGCLGQNFEDISEVMRGDGNLREATQLIYSIINNFALESFLEDEAMVELFSDQQDLAKDDEYDWRLSKPTEYGRFKATPKAASIRFRDQHLTRGRNNYVKQFGKMYVHGVKLAHQKFFSMPYQNVPLSAREVRFQRSRKSGTVAFPPLHTAGKYYWNMDKSEVSAEGSPYQKSIDALQTPQVGGLSGSTDLFMTVFHYLGGHQNQREKDKLALGTLGYLIDQGHHSAHEVLETLRDYGYHYEIGPNFWKTQDNQSLLGKFPGLKNDVKKYYFEFIKKEFNLPKDVKKDQLEQLLPGKIALACDTRPQKALIGGRCSSLNKTRRLLNLDRLQKLSEELEYDAIDKELPQEHERIEKMAESKATALKKPLNGYRWGPKTSAKLYHKAPNALIKPGTTTHLSSSTIAGGGMYLSRNVMDSSQFAKKDTTPLRVRMPKGSPMLNFKNPKNIYSMMKEGISPSEVYATDPKVMIEYTHPNKNAAKDVDDEWFVRKRGAAKGEHRLVDISSYPLEKVLQLYHYFQDKRDEEKGDDDPDNFAFAWVEKELNRRLKGYTPKKDLPKGKVQFNKFGQCERWEAEEREEEDDEEKKDRKMKFVADYDSTKCLEELYDDDETKENFTYKMDLRTNQCQISYGGLPVAFVKFSFDINHDADSIFEYSEPYDTPGPMYTTCRDQYRDHFTTKVIQPNQSFYKKKAEAPPHSSEDWEKMKKDQLQCADDENLGCYVLGITKKGNIFNKHYPSKQEAKDALRELPAPLDVKGQVERKLQKRRGIYLAIKRTCAATFGCEITNKDKAEEELYNPEKAYDKALSYLRKRGQRKYGMSPYVGVDFSVKLGAPIIKFDHPSEQDKKRFLAKVMKNLPGKQHYLDEEGFEIQIHGEAMEYLFEDEL